MYIDIHTHHTSTKSSQNIAIVNTQPGDYIADETIRVSAGLHPWYIDEADYNKKLEELKSVALQERVVAIGECGLDKLSNTPFELQSEVFVKQIEISEAVCKPLIIHCVKSYNEIVALKRLLKPKQRWILHSFRGKPQVAGMLKQEGIILSLGERFNPEIAQIVLATEIFVESDESNLPIEAIYELTAKIWSISTDQLKQNTAQLYNNIFKQNNKL